MVASLRFIDFSPRILMQEGLSVGTYSQGAYTHEDLRKLPFDEYEELLREVVTRSKNAR